MSSRKKTYGAGWIRREEMTWKFLDTNHLDVADKNSEGIEFVVRFLAVTGTTDYIYTLPDQVNARVIGAQYLMIGAGGANMTATLYNNGFTNAITDTKDLSAASASAQGLFASIIDAYAYIAGGNTLQLKTAANLSAHIIVKLLRVTSATS